MLTLVDSFLSLTAGTTCLGKAVFGRANSRAFCCYNFAMLRCCLTGLRRFIDTKGLVAVTGLLIT